MSQAKISYFSLSGLQGKEAKLDWISATKFEVIKFENISPDGKGNWINQTDNDFDSFLPLVDKEVKTGRSEEAVFKLFSSGVQTKRDEWAYSLSKTELVEKMKYFIETYQEHLKHGITTNLEIKWDHDLIQYLERKIQKTFEETQVFESMYRPYIKQFLYFDKHFNARTFQMFYIFPKREIENKLIAVTNHIQIPFLVQATSYVPSLDVGGRPGQCLPLYRYDENGDRIENITDWALERFRERYLPSPPAPLPQERGVREPSSTDPLPQEGGARLKDGDLARLAGARRDVPEVLLQKAKELRQKQTPAEQMLWQCLRSNQLHGAKFRRQHNIGQCIVDFYCHAAKLVIELDGGIHELQKERDSDRDTWLQANGLQVLRLKNEEITQNLPQVLQTITNHLSLLSPSPAGEGLGVRAEITKLDIFHYTYAVLHHPTYRTKYELNLKREFPRLPFYENFHQWVSWGKSLMDLHLNYETIAPYGLQRLEIATKANPKPKLATVPIFLDENTQLTGVPNLAWEYKLGNRAALEWILDQYKEKKPKDPTIAKLFNTYKFADYKARVIDLLQRVCTVSIRTMEIIQQMP